MAINRKMLFNLSDFSISATRWRQHVVEILKCDFLKIVELENFKKLVNPRRKMWRMFRQGQFCHMTRKGGHTKSTW